MTSCCSCPICFHRLGSRRFKSGDIPPVCLLTCCCCHCHRGWSAHPPTLPPHTGRGDCIWLQIHTYSAVPLACVCVCLYTQHRTSSWLLPVASLLFPFRERPACCRQTCLLLFGSCATVDVTSQTSESVSTLSGQPNRNAPAWESCPARPNVNTKHPNPVTGGNLGR